MSTSVACSPCRDPFDKTPLAYQPNRLFVVSSLSPHRNRGNIFKVVCVTYLPLVGYTILLRDLLAPVLEVMMDRTLNAHARNLMVSVLVLLVRVP